MAPRWVSCILLVLLFQACSVSAYFRLSDGEVYGSLSHGPVGTLEAPRIDEETPSALSPQAMHWPGLPILFAYKLVLFVCVSALFLMYLLSRTLRQEVTDGIWGRLFNLKIHAGLLLVFATFAEGDIQLKLAMRGVHPVLLETIRQGTVFSVALVITIFSGRPLLPDSKDVFRALSSGIIWFSQMFCMVLGMKASSATSFAIWQPSIPVICCLLAACAGYEHFSLKKAMGVIIVSGGALMHAIFDTSYDGDDNGQTPMRLVGNVFFLCQVICCAWYIIQSKALLRTYSFISVQMWSIGGSFFLSCFAVAVGQYYPEIREFYCRSKSKMDSDACFAAGLHIPGRSYGGLIFQIIACGLIANPLMVFLTAFVKPSVVSGYTAVQPLFVALFSTLYVKYGSHPFEQLQSIELPQNHFWLALSIIVSGLLLVCSEGSVDEEAREGPERECVRSKLEAAARGSA